MSRKAQAKMQENKESYISKANNTAMRAIVIKASGEEASKALEDEKFFIGIEGVIPTPYNLGVLCMMRENSSELGQCVDAMVTNITSFGYRLVPHTMSKTEAETNADAIATEHARIKTFLDHINFEDSITTLKEETRREKEETGNAYWELVPFINGEGISSIERLDPASIRITKQDEKPTTAKRSFYNGFTKQIETKLSNRRFRRFVQQVGTKKVWFKEYGDPRNIDSTNGKIISNKELFQAKKDGRIAHAIIHHKIKNSRSPYGIPRYAGNLFSIYGSRAADQINYITFENNNIPSMMILVSNGQLTGESVTRVKEFIDGHVKGSMNRSSFLVLEAESQSENQINPGTMKMEVKDLSSAQKDDQLFQNYDKNNAEKLRRCWRLPPIFVGKSDDYNRSTAQESRKLADEQIFAPERNRDDMIINKMLINEFGMKFHSYVSNSANVTNDDDLVKILSYGEKTGGVTPNLSRIILSDILNKQLPLYNKDEVGFDPDIPMSMTLVGLSQTLGGNANTGKIAPNQQQMTGVTKNESEIMKAINKLFPSLVDDILKGIYSDIDQSGDE